jgi:hypothetical protein
VRPGNSVRSATLAKAVVTTPTSGGGKGLLATEAPAGAAPEGEEAVLLAGQALSKLAKQTVYPSLDMKADVAMAR